MQAGSLAMNRYTAGNSVTLLRNGAEYFPVLLEAIALAEREVWLETYIFADDDTGPHRRRCADRAPRGAASSCACWSTAGARGTT